MELNRLIEVVLHINSERKHNTSQCLSQEEFEILYILHCSYQLSRDATYEVSGAFILQQLRLNDFGTLINQQQFLQNLE